MRDSRRQPKLAADMQTRRLHYSCSWKVDCKIGHTLQRSNAGCWQWCTPPAVRSEEHSQPDLSAAVIRATGGLPKHGLSEQEHQPGEELPGENVPFREITQEGSNPTCPPRPPPSDAPPPHSDPLLRHHLPGSIAPGDPIVSPAD